MTIKCDFCGGYVGNSSKSRSVPQLNRYHKLVSATFDNWPETHEHQFANIIECRKWLEMKAGHREIGAQIPVSGMSKERAVMLAEAAIRGAGSYAMPVMHGDTLVIFRPKSIRFATMPHLAFCELVAAVESVIEKETGARVDDLLLERA